MVISGRSKEKGSALAESLGENASYIVSDTTNESDIKKSQLLTQSIHLEVSIYFLIMPVVL